VPRPAVHTAGRRRASGAGSSKRLTQERRKLRRKLLGYATPADAEPSPSGPGAGKKPQQEWTEEMYDLVRNNLIRARDGTYFR
jgi:hypothetical protein